MNWMKISESRYSAIQKKNAYELHKFRLHRADIEDHTAAGSTYLEESENF